MGGVGSGRRAGSSRFPGLARGRLAGVCNTPEHTEAMRAGMLAVYAMKASAPDRCEECDREPDRGMPGGAALERFQGRWLCGMCLSDEMEPLRIEDFVWTGTSCLGAACDEASISGHAFGPFGDQALSTEKTRAAAARRRARSA